MDHGGVPDKHVPVGLGGCEERQPATGKLLLCPGRGKEKQHGKMKCRQAKRYQVFSGMRTYTLWLIKLVVEPGMGETAVQHESYYHP
ncbi:UNVERIFIED_CONTAM: hypothetical protein FKN15_002934 [Acipenser sinensis]